MMKNLNSGILIQGHFDITEPRLFLCVYLILWIELGGTLPLNYITSPFYYFILRRGLTKLLRLALDLWSSCFSLLSRWASRRVLPSPAWWSPLTGRVPRQSRDGRAMEREHMSASPGLSSFKVTNILQGNSTGMTWSNPHPLLKDPALSTMVRSVFHPLNTSRWGVNVSSWTLTMPIPSWALWWHMILVTWFSIESPACSPIQSGQLLFIFRSNVLLRHKFIPNFTCRSWINCNI